MSRDETTITKSTQLMHYYRSLEAIPVNMPNTVVTIGNFDGLHLGHQQVIQQVLSEANKRQLQSVVVSFDPYPKEFFIGTRVPRLMSWREKYLALKAIGVDYFVTIPFNQTLSQMPAENFVKDIIVDRLHAHCVIIGDDFHFGQKRRGNYALLCEQGKQYQFDVMQMSTFEVLDERVSSSRIRHTLQAGNMALAEKLLGHHYYLSGTVIHGDKLGRELGFPTANIDLHRRLVPLSGVFVVRVVFNDETYYGAANIGTRPAVNGTRVLLEIYIFDFNREIYGQNINVTFLHKLRDEAHYDNLELLKAQIAQDVAAAKAYLES